MSLVCGLCHAMLVVLMPSERSAPVVLLCVTFCLPLQVAEADMLKLSNKVRFIKAVVAGQMVISNRKKADIEGQLEQEGYDRLAKVSGAQPISLPTGHIVLCALLLFVLVMVVAELLQNMLYVTCCMSHAP